MSDSDARDYLIEKGLSPAEVDRCSARQWRTAAYAIRYQCAVRALRRVTDGRRA